MDFWRKGNGVGFIWGGDAGRRMIRRRRLNGASCVIKSRGFTERWCSVSYLVFIAEQNSDVVIGIYLPEGV